MVRTLIIASTFLSAFLLFMIQPMYAKFLLPFFGGTSSVWTISIFFYSAILLLGYIYAALLTSWPSQIARWVHTSLLFLAGLMLFYRGVGEGSPFMIGAVESSAPALSVLLTLFMGVGLPVLLLASTSVLVQYLYARLTTKEPYTLFALSNTGSLLGLAAYPFLFEPFTSLPLQSTIWASAFIFFAVLMAVVWKQVDMIGVPIKALVSPISQVILKHRGKIVFMAAIPTFLLAATTEYLSQGIASFPLLWVIPLMLYLISFIISFRNVASPTPEIPLGSWALLAFIPVFALLPVISTTSVIYWIGFIAVCSFFFLVATYFHRRVYDLRPRVSDLGSFYVWLTFGGALGSGVVGLLLPLVLDKQIELYFAFGAIATYLAFTSLAWLKKYIGGTQLRILQFIIVISSIFFIISLSTKADPVFSQRNFYGTINIFDTTKTVNNEIVPVRIISNGSTNHGLQALDDTYSGSAASYYGPDSGIDIALRSFIDNGEAPRVNVIGLGAGMMNAYCEDIASISYIEINPDVEVVAREFFTYLEMCPDKTQVAIGDGRLMLEAEANGKEIVYDVIMMDAFTDNAIPSHLLTAQAFERAYKPLLSENGVVAFHISNRYLNLHPPIVGMARAQNYEAVSVVTTPDGTNDLHFPTVWVLITKPENIDRLLSYPNTARYTGEVLVWTDDRSSVMDVLSLTGSTAKQ